MKIKPNSQSFRRTSSRSSSLSSLRIGLLAFASLTLLPACALAQGSARQPAVKTPAVEPAQIPPQASAYYNAMLAHGYEEQAFAEGQPEDAQKAVDAYKAALAIDPTDPTLNDSLAELYFRTGRVKEAIDEATAEIARNPKSLPAHKLLGRIYLRSLGDGQNTPQSAQMLQLAIAEYNLIVGMEPNNIEDHLLLGQLYSFAKDPVKAQQQFAAAQKIDPHSEEVVLNLARIDSEQNDIHGAIQTLSSLPQEDQTAKTEYVLGVSYDQVKDTKKAIAAYKASLALEPDNLDVERALADALRHDGQDKAALAAYNDVIDGDPTDAGAYLHAAEIDRKEGRLDDALAKLKKAAPLASDSLEIRYNEALTFEQLGQYPDAERMFATMVQESEHSTGDYSEGEKNNYALFVDHLGDVYTDEAKTDQAVATYARLIPLGGDYALSGYGSQADAYRQAHQYSKAVDVLQAAVAKYPKNRGLKLMLAQQLAISGKYDQGVSLAKSLINNSPQDRDVYLTLAQMSAGAKKWKDADDQLDKAQILSPNPAEQVAIAIERATIEDRQKHYDAAEADYQKALSLDPANSTVLNDYGYMLANRGVRLNDALDMIQKAVKLDPQNYANLDSLGWAYFKLGQYGLAESNLTKAVQRSALDATVHEHLGDLYEKTDRLKQAASQWEQSLQLLAQTDPGDAEPGEGSRLQKKLDSARGRLAKDTNAAPGNTPAPGSGKDTQQH